MAILSDFDGGRSLHDTQHFALGQEVYMIRRGIVGATCRSTRRVAVHIACFVRRNTPILCLLATAL